MKLIVRADDFGYCKAINLGILDCIENGIVTTVELMVDMPGSEHAAEILKDYPAISTALHCHFQGKACADPKLIPSLVDENGNLVIRKRKKENPAYKPDLLELFTEYKAQFERFRELTGHNPDYLKPLGPNAERIKEFAKELNIPCDYRGGFELGPIPIFPVREWEYLDYYTVPVLLTKEHDKVENQAKLDSIGYFLKDEAGILSCGHNIVEMVMHPGWLDEYVYENSSYTIIRLKDMIALKSKEVKGWIRDNGIELISAYDALYGTNNYQEYVNNRGGL